MDWIFGSCAGFWFSLYSHSYTSWYSLAHRNTKMELEHLEMWGQWRAWALLTFPLATDFALHVSFYLLQIRWKLDSWWSSVTANYFFLTILWHFVDLTQKTGKFCSFLSSWHSFWALYAESASSLQAEWWCCVNFPSGHYFLSILCFFSASMQTL